MKTAVKFENVSKKYNLGVTRTSILKAFSGTIRNAVGAKAQNSPDQVLWALRDVSFELAQGESLALVGRNGAGKSTLLKLLANITHPTQGNIEVNGRVSALIELGSGFHHDLTGRENIYLNGAILGLSRSEIRRRLDEIVAFSEIERFIETPVKRYSSGMLVRLGFAIASCIEPDILLVDEVLAVGDAPFAQKCLHRIQSLLDNGTSIIFVSHNLYMVQSVCRSSLYIEHGQIKQRGATAEVIDAYERDIHEERARKFAAAQSDQDDIGTDVQITQVEVLDKSGHNLNETSSQATIEIRVHYQTIRSPGTANAAIRIIRTDGMTCCMMRTSLDNVQLLLREGGGVFSVVVEPPQLTGGTYFVDARITTASDNVILARAQSKWFYVSGLALSHEDDTGVFEPLRTWRPDPMARSTISEHYGNGAVHSLVGVAHNNGT